MILKKPYAFLIKRFKLIHIVLLLLMSYLLYCTNIILNFFQQYIGSNQLMTGKDFTGELFNIWMFALPFIIGTILLILLGVMYYKKKPLLFYIYNILLMIAVLVFYNIGYDTIQTLETKVLELRTLRLIRDLFAIIILFQGLGVLLTFIRATGFDIKKFNFGEDLEALEITENDNEEFELDVNIETNVLKRGINRNIRFSRYIYTENKFIINIVILILFSTICFIIYSNLTIYNKFHNENELFLASDYTMSVTKSYLITEDYRGNKITDNYLLILDLNIRANYSNESIFNTAKAELKINNNIYYPIDKMRSNLIDIGTVYEHTNINRKDFEHILLVYEIPKKLGKEKMILTYIDDISTSRKGLNPKYIKIKLNPYELDKENKIIPTNLNEIREINSKIFKTTNIYFTSFEINERFKLNYKYCIKTNCYDSIEYLNPLLNTNYDKALLKIEGTLNLESNNKNIYDLYTFIKSFGKIKYEINGITKYYSNMNRIIPSKVDLENTLYLEIPKEIISSNKIDFLIDIRDEIYEFSIK